MSRDMAPRIRSVRARTTYILEVEWQGGGRAVVDVTDFLKKFRVYQPLLTDQSLFAQVAPDEYGVGVAWTDWIDLSGYSLAVMARDQGQPVPEFTDPFRTAELTTP